MDGVGRPDWNLKSKLTPDISVNKKVNYLLYLLASPLPN